MKQVAHRLLIRQSLGFRILAFPLSIIFAGATRLRNLAFAMKLLRQHRLPGKCISVGNLTIGGTGKSPLVMTFARYLLARGYTPAILTRGYGADLGPGGILLLRGGEVEMRFGSGTEVPDEARMQSALLPDVAVIVGVDRGESAAAYLALAEKPPTHWLLDDGFQHRRIARDVDVVLLDAHAPFGNGNVLPLGLLREEVRNLQRATSIVFTRSQMGFPTEKTRNIVSRVTTAPQFCAGFSTGWPRRLLVDGNLADGMPPIPAVVVAGIAHPDRFLEELRTLGVVIEEQIIVADHGPLPRETIKGLRDPRVIVTTWKDFFRDRELFLTVLVPVYIAELNVNLPSADIDRILAPTILVDSFCQHRFVE